MAHGFEPQHAVFNRPIKFDIEYEEFDTPPNYFSYRSGESLGEKMKGLRIHNKESTPVSLRIGNVFAHQSFEQAPDGEVISPGSNSRSCKSAAIARHGNFLGWGYSVDPSHMTPQARMLFANCVDYIGNFDGQTPIFRAPTGKVPFLNLTTTIHVDSRDSLLDKPNSLGNAERIFEQVYDIQAGRPERLRELQEKQKSGTLSQMETIYMQMAKRKLSLPETQSEFRDKHFKRVAGKKLFQQFGHNLDLYREYFDTRSRTEYFDLDARRFVEDLETQQLGFDVGDPRMLDAAISMLEYDPKDGTANTLLHRYTNFRFDTPAQWREWLDKYKAKIFFHETAGYKFLVDSRGMKSPDSADAENGDTELKAMSSEKLKAISDNASFAFETSNRKPVAVACEAITEPLGKGNVVTLVVNFKIHQGWHIYATTGKNSSLFSTTAEIDESDSFELLEAWQKPSTAMSSTGAETFESNVTWTRRVRLKKPKGKVTIPVVVSFMSCNSYRCNRPKSIEQTFEIEIAD